MIEPKEIRIGNLLNHSELGIVEVIGVGKYYIHVIYNGETHYENIRSFSTIPLTEEILIKAGFEKDLHCGYESVYHHKNFDLCIYNKIGTLGFELHEVEGFTINHEPFFNLHQLQNLFFSLCGEELNPVEP